MNTNTIQIGRAMLDAFNARDLNAWAAQLSDDYTGSYPGMRAIAGKEAARAYNAPFLTAFSDLNFQINQVFEKGDTVVYAWTGAGTHDGPLATPAGQVPPTGRRGPVEGVLISTVKNGKIVREETYWNQIDLLTQLGLM